MRADMPTACGLVRSDNDSGLYANVGADNVVASTPADHDVNRHDEGCRNLGDGGSNVLASLFGAAEVPLGADVGGGNPLFLLDWLRALSLALITLLLSYR